MLLSNITNIAPRNTIVDTFSGNGSQTVFILSQNPGTKNNTLVNISGVTQQKSTYSVSGTTLTFTTAPPSGTANIEVVSSCVTVGQIPADGSVTTAKLAFDGGALSGFRNVIINGNFNINQRGYVSGAAVGTALYGHDRWKMPGSADTYTYSTTANVTTVTIPAGKVLRQVIEGLNLQSGTYVLSWTGTAQGKIGAGSYGASGITGTATGGTDLTIEFGPGTVSKVQFEFGPVATPFEARPVGTELALCQRYCFICTPFLAAYFAGGVSPSAPIIFPVKMRAIPTIIIGSVITSGGTATGAGVQGTTTTDTSFYLVISTGAGYYQAPLTATAEL